MDLMVAKAARRFLRVTEVDDQGRLRKAICPGFGCAAHEIILSRRNGYIEVECFSQGKPCPENCEGMCFHVMATLLEATHRLGRTYFYAEQWEADHVAAQFRGYWIKIVSKQSGKVIYNVYQTSPPRPVETFEPSFGAKIRAICRKIREESLARYGRTEKPCE